MWNFPRAIGAIDGKHVVIQNPEKAGSEFFNYKRTFSIVLLGIVNAEYNFIYVHVGTQGRISDGGVFKATQFAQALENNQLNFPPQSPLPGRETPVPNVFVADDAFPLAIRIIKPYGGHQLTGSKERIYNYRLSRARRIVENAFGILSSVFRVYRKPLLLEPDKAVMIILASLCLYNFLRRNKESQRRFTPIGVIDFEDVQTGDIRFGSWRNDISEGLTNLRINQRNASQVATSIRNEFAEYFISSAGQVHWQWNK